MQQNLEQKNLTLSLVFVLFLTLSIPTLFPHMRLLFFAPFLIIVYYKKSFLASLWTSLFCGLFLDLLSSHTHLGFHATSYCLSTALLYSQRRNFFADSLSTLPLMTYFFSSIATLFQMGLMHFFEQRIQFSWEWVMTDLVYMPGLDALYAFACFILPARCFGKRPRRGRDYFLSE